MENWVNSNEVYRGRVVSLRVGTVQLSDGTIAEREVVEHPGGVAIVPVFNEQVILIKQYRIAVGKDVVEVPAGKLEPGDDPTSRARCELEEEVGFRAGRLVEVPPVYASVGYSSEKIHFFLAFDLDEIGQRLECDERIERVPVPINELRDRLARHEFDDAKTIVGLQKLLAYLRSRDSC